MEFTVHPETYLRIVLFRADVNIAGPLANPLRKYRINQADHGRFLGHPLQGTHLDIFGRLRLFTFFVVVLHIFHVFQDATDAGIGTIKRTEKLVEFLFGANDGFHLIVSRNFNSIYSINIHWICHGHC